MKILFDCRYTRIERHDGISRYTAGLVAALGRIADVELLISDPRQLAQLPDLPAHVVSGPTSIREPLVALQVRRIGADVVFSPMQTMGSWGRRYGLVLTLHDLIYYRNPTPPPEFAWPIRLLWRLYHLAWWPQRVLLNRADAVVTVSATTAELMARHRLTRRPVTVVPNAPEPTPDPSRLPRTGALVYMGSFMPYKNVEVLARAMARLPDHELHLMSRATEADRARLTALAGGGRLVFHDGASDELYRETLRGATALVTASRDEGFGIPLVEAMGVGTPVVVSDIPVFREVGGDAAAYFPPDDVDAVVAAVRELDDPERWEKRSAAARAQAERYTWERSAATLLTVLERAAATHSR
ncbi:glycosyltransferase family 4 protein [Pseudonocardia sp. TRM90224]|uniref:glycosyltransferase family 4 protein n=1 Tax=Pseudonocardia sp. TRM90224 TaxID=2812678 RepID=UPI001E5D9F2D|nr:glycosyltransferase family 1 protein [Pseudonocardia sp. TRM90224]